MKNSSYDGFFIGWGKKLPKGLSPFLVATVLFVFGLFAGTAFSFVVTQNDPGPGAFRFDLGRQTIVGVMQAEPYPVIHISPNEKYPQGHSIMLSGQGKRGVVDQAVAMDGQVVTARGVLLKRGDLDMLQVGGEIHPVSDAAAPVIGVRQLGRYRLSGEICDGKCYAGAMRPGNGLAHKACANLCLFGGIPPVFVAAGQVEGSSFFLLAGADGKPLDQELYNLTAVLMEIEGEIEKRGDMLLFKIDLDTVRVL